MARRANTAALIGGIFIAQLVLAGVMPRVAVIKSSSVLPFNQATEAMLDGLHHDSLQPEVLTFDLDGDEARAAAVLEAVSSAHPQLVITVGSLATAAVLKASLTTPIVFSMVLYPRESGFLTASGQKTGVSLDVPFDVQFKYLRRLCPTARRVGVLYNIGETGALVDEARRAATAKGFTLVAEPVDEPLHALATLDSLMGRVDVMWSLADSHVFTPQTTSALILASLRRGIPLFGLSTAHVRAGAVAALYLDYADIGRQTGQTALRVLHGEPAGTIPVAVPRTVALALNLRSAQHVNLPISPELEAEAREVIR